MSDLPDARIDAISKGAKVESSALQYLIDEMQAMALELQRRRSDHVSDADRIRAAVASSVRELCGMGPWPPPPELCAAVAGRVMDRLAGAAVTDRDR